MTSPGAAERKQNEKLRFVPVWPVVAAFLVVALAVWLASR
jgi:type VI protein secretion system component VasF